MTLSTRIAILFTLGITALRLWLYLYNYPTLDSLDPSLEYLVASHIVNFKEFPLTGTTGLNGAASVNSPAYYYFLAFFLLFHRSVFTLYSVNILLQAIMGLAIYSLVKNLFGSFSGLVSLFVTSLSMWGMQSSRFFFQPYLSQTVFFVSVYILSVAFRRSSYRFLITSIFLYLLAASFYLSPFLYAPLYGACILYWHKGKKARLIWKTVAVFLTSFLFLFGSVIILYPYQSEASIVTRNVAEVVEKFTQFFQLFTYLTFPYPWNMPVVWSVFWIASCIFFFMKRPVKQKMFAGLLCTGILVPLFVLPWFRIPASEHYLHLSIGFFLLYISILLGRIFFSHPIGYIPGLCIFFASVYMTSNAFSYREPSYFQKAQQAIDATLPYTRTDVSFTRVFAGYAEGKMYYASNDDFTFWHLLEEKTGINRTPTNILTGIPVVPLDTEYVILTCTGDSPDLLAIIHAQCTSEFMRKHDYVKITSLFLDEPFHTYLMKKAHTDLEFTTLGNTHLSQFRLPEAHGAYTKALSINAHATSARVGLGRIAYLRGDYKTAEELFVQTKSYFDLGKLYRVTHRYKESEAAFRNARAADPKDTGLLYGLAYLYMQYREFDKAEAALNQAIAIDPNNDSLYGGLGDLYLRMKQFGKSEAMFQKALSIKPDSDVFIGLGELYTATNRHAQAEKVLQRGLLINPKPDRYLALGNLYLEIKQFSLAESMFMKTRELNPVSNWCIGLGNTYMQQSKLDESEKTLKQCLETPYKAQAWLALGNLYMHMKRFDLAKNMLELAITDEEVKPFAQESMNNLLNAL